MDEELRIKDMFEMHDEDAMEVVRVFAALVNKHDTMPGIVKELTAKYGEKSILSGMMMQQAIERNDRACRCDGVTEEFMDPVFVIGTAFGMSDDETEEICRQVKSLTINNRGWKSMFASVGSLFGERAVYAGAFMLFMYLELMGKPEKKYDFGHG